MSEFYNNSHDKNNLIENNAKLSTHLDNHHQEPLLIFFVHGSTDWANGPAKLKEIDNLSSVKRSELEWRRMVSQIPKRQPFVVQHGVLHRHAV